ncbi:MAG TPA: OB-fold nucleic acid binding domain-containing protein, partial [Acetobacteraceae bacterium]|nr:OB-fold nucleic acid binding domain-containing protein [Acetobacteraceae bacterium]
WDCTLERNESGALAIRLGLRMAKGLANKHGADLVLNRADTPYASISDIHRRGAIPATALERLAEADGFGALRLDRRQALWHVRALADTDLPLFAVGETINEPSTHIAAMTEGREVVEDYRSVGLSLRHHPVAFLRAELKKQKILAAAELAGKRDGAQVQVAGIVLVRQRPGSAHGVLFITIEDESGHANLIVWPALFERQRRLVLSASMLSVRGRLQREGEVTHIIARDLVDYSDLLKRIGAFALPHGRGDEAKHGGGIDPRGIPPRARDNIKVKTRDFH